jgi:hypothetical protein
MRPRPASLYLDTDVGMIGLPQRDVPIKQIDRRQNYIVIFSLFLGPIFLLAFILYPVVSSTSDFELAYNEGWNAYHQIAALSSNIYLNESPYVFTNYTPLSFYIIGIFTQYGDPITIGRIISILSFLVLIAAVGSIARRLGASRPETLFGSVLCIGLLGAYHRIYIGIDDPQLLGSAVSLTGLLMYVSLRPGLVNNTLVLVALLAAGLIKQTLIAIPMTIAVDLILRDRPEGIKFFVQALLMTIAAALALYLIFEYRCFTQMLSPRQYSIHAGATLTLGYLIVASVSLPLAILFLARYVRCGNNRLVLIYLLSALLSGAFLSGGAGIGSNMFVDLAIASSIAAAVILRCLREDLHADGRLIAAFIFVSIYGPTLQIPYAIEQLRDGLSGSLRAAQAKFHEDLDFMANYPGEAFCDSPMLCFRAGREFLVDPFNASQAIKLGRLDPSPLLDKVGRGEFAIIQLSTLEGHPFGPPLNGGPDVEREFRRILDERYRMVRTNQRRVFYVPR